ncbi:MAG: ABC transporter permease, partial [Planctomycetota bacterium]
MSDVAENAAPAAEGARAPVLGLAKASTGFWCALPLLLLLGLGFLAPLALVVLYSFMPRGSFSPFGSPTLENYVAIVEQNFHISFAWSLWLALVSTAILLVVAYPLALAITRAAPRRALVLTALVVAPLFVAENIRLQG